MTPPVTLDVPSLIGAFPNPVSLATMPECSAPVWPGQASVAAFGRWRPGELRNMVCAGGRLVLVGQCFADDHVVEAGFRRALDTDRLDLVTRWPGSYLAIVLRPHDLTAFVDLAGQYLLYYRSAAGRTVFGTRAGAAARAAGLSCEPDTLAIAAEVFCPEVPLPTDGRSIYRGLDKLAGGHALRVDCDGVARTWAYETLTPDRKLSLPDAADSLRTALETAVRARNSVTMTADFSGGLDSTSVAFLAARHRNEALPVFTYYQPEAPADDLAHAQRYLPLDRRLQPHVIRGTRATLTYQGLGTATSTDLPDPGAVHELRTVLRLRRIADAGRGVHLGGEGADALLVAAPGYLGDLARLRAVRRLGRDCHHLAKLRRVSPAQVLARSTRLSMTTRGRALNMLADRLENPVDRNVEWLDAIAWWPQPGAEGTWLTTRMRRELVELVRSGAAAAATSASETSVGDSTALSELRTAGTVQRQLDERARPLGVWPQAPFLDNDVIRACLTVPSYQRADPLVRKPLLGKALSGLVPDAVFARQSKGNYTGEDYRGARFAAAELTARVARTRLADLGVVEPSPVQASLRRAVAGLPVPFPTFNRLLGLDLWLQDSNDKG